MDWWVLIFGGLLGAICSSLPLGYWVYLLRHWLRVARQNLELVFADQKELIMKLRLVPFERARKLVPSCPESLERHGLKRPDGVPAIDGHGPVPRVIFMKTSDQNQAVDLLNIAKCFENACIQMEAAQQVVMNATEIINTLAASGISYHDVILARNQLAVQYVAINDALENQCVEDLRESADTTRFIVLDYIIDHNLAVRDLKGHIQQALVDGRDEEAIEMQEELARSMGDLTDCLTTLALCIRDVTHEGSKAIFLEVQAALKKEWADHEEHLSAARKMLESEGKLEEASRLTPRKPPYPRDVPLMSRYPLFSSETQKSESETKEAADAHRKEEHDRIMIDKIGVFYGKCKDKIAYMMNLGEQGKHQKLEFEKSLKKLARTTPTPNTFTIPAQQTGKKEVNSPSRPTHSGEYNPLPRDDIGTLPASGKKEVNSPSMRGIGEYNPLPRDYIGTLSASNLEPLTSNSGIASLNLPPSEHEYSDQFRYFPEPDRENFKKGFEEAQLARGFHLNEAGRYEPVLSDPLLTEAPWSEESQPRFRHTKENETKRKILK